MRRGNLKLTNPYSHSELDSESKKEDAELNSA
jgi:hypothetical protein